MAEIDAIPAADGALLEQRGYYPACEAYRPGPDLRARGLITVEEWGRRRTAVIDETQASLGMKPQWAPGPWRRAMA